MKYFIILYGIGGGYGGISNGCVVKVKDKDEATSQAELHAFEELEMYEGDGSIRSIECIMEEDEVDREEAEDSYNYERESWIVYEVYEYTKELEEKYSEMYHWENHYEEETKNLK